MMETSFNSLGMEIDGVKYASFTTDERRWITVIRKLSEKNPGKVIIKKDPKDNEGCLYCWIPSDWLHINVPKKVILTEEQKEFKRKLLHSNIRTQNMEDCRFVVEKNDEELPFTDMDEDLPTEEDDRLI